MTILIDQSFDPQKSACVNSYYIKVNLNRAVNDLPVPNKLLMIDTNYYVHISTNGINWCMYIGKSMAFVTIVCITTT